MKPKNPEKKEQEVVEEHQEWALEKQTEGLDPALEEATKEIEEEATKAFAPEEESEA